MDKTERETHDFMNVQSFSQLPFIRPAPSVKDKAIRLFGIDFNNGGAADATTAAESEETTTLNNAFEVDRKDNHNNNNNNSSNETGESSRRFECHYCCRNFPTSQALGGHQNAHKRERQHAKRQHLQSTMVHGSAFSDSHVYGLMNYRFAPSPSPTNSSFGYPTWHNANGPATTSSGRFYGNSYSHHHLQQQQQPINGSPLAFWRIPNNASLRSNNNNNNNNFSSSGSFNHERSLPLFAGEELNNLRAPQVGVGGGGSAASSQNRYGVYDSKCGVHSDHVSLDLHL